VKNAANCERGTVGSVVKNETNMTVTFTRQNGTDEFSLTYPTPSNVSTQYVYNVTSPGNGTASSANGQSCKGGSLVAAIIQLDQLSPWDTSSAAVAFCNPSAEIVVVDATFDSETKTFNASNIQAESTEVQRLYDPNRFGTDLATQPWNGYCVDPALSEIVSPDEVAGLNQLAYDAFSGNVDGQWMENFFTHNSAGTLYPGPSACTLPHLVSAD
jgi:hypothetical protein